MPDRVSARAWQIVIPARGVAPAKSRLDVPTELRSRLARAFSLDTVGAAVSAASVERVTVVTAASAVDVFERLGAQVLVEPQPPSLAAAIDAGLATCDLDAPRAVLLGDSPPLTGEALDEALALAAQHPCAVVGDADGTGTTLLTAMPGHAHTPAFGGGSLKRHIGHGYTPLTTGVPARVRADVDTVDALVHAAALGLGVETSAVLDSAPEWSRGHIPEI